MTTGDRFDLYARWTGKQITVHYNGGTDATGTTADETFTYGTDAKLAGNNFERIGYEFSGWATSSTATMLSYTEHNEVDQIILENLSVDEITLYAVWVKIDDVVYVKGR